VAADVGGGNVDDVGVEFGQVALDPVVDPARQAVFRAPGIGMDGRLIRSPVGSKAGVSVVGA